MMRMTRRTVWTVITLGCCSMWLGLPPHSGRVPTASAQEEAQSDPKLELLGMFSATCVMVTESFLGAAADGLSEELYTKPEEIVPDLQRTTNMLKVCLDGIQKIRNESLSAADQKFMAGLTDVIKLQQQQADALIAFANSKDKADLRRWAQTREAIKPKIAALFGESSESEITYENVREKLPASLRENFVHFKFTYPKYWKLDPKAGVEGAPNFVKVESAVEEDGKTFTLENFAVGSLTFTGEVNEGNEQELLKQLTDQFAEQFAKGFPNFELQKQGRMKFGKYRGYGMEFTSLVQQKGQEDMEIYGRVVLLPPAVTQQENGATIIMLATSHAEGIDSLADLGVNGDLPSIIESFELTPAPPKTKKKQPQR